MGGIEVLTTGLELNLLSGKTSDDFTRNGFRLLHDVAINTSLGISDNRVIFDTPTNGISLTLPAVSTIYPGWKTEIHNSNTSTAIIGVNSSSNERIRVHGGIYKNFVYLEGETSWSLIYSGTGLHPTGSGALWFGQYMFNTQAYTL